MASALTVRATMTDLFLHPVEQRAREIWVEREEGFPAFVRQTWDQGTWLARRATLVTAAKELGRFDLLEPPPPPTAP